MGTKDTKDLGKAQKRIRNAWIAGVFFGTFILIFSWITTLVHGSPPSLPYAILIYGLTLGIYKRNSVCAILMFLTLLTHSLSFVPFYSFTYMPTQLVKFLIVIATLYFSLQGILGTFAYHRLTWTASLKRILYIIGCIIGCIGLFILMLSNLGVDKESAKSTQCASNLKQIGLALIMYSNENDEKFPYELSDLYPEYISEKKIFRCPSDKLVTVKANASIEEGVPFTKNQCSYGYDPTHTQADDPGVALASDRPSYTADNIIMNANSPNHGGTVSPVGVADIPGRGQNVVYLDGHVEFVSTTSAGWYDKDGNRDNIFVDNIDEGTRTDSYIVHEGQMPTVTLTEALEALKDKDRGVRSRAAWALEKLKDLRAVGPLIDALKDEDRGVRSHAASALGELKDSRVVGPLIAAALKDEHGAVRKNAAKALGKLKDSRVVKSFIAAFKDEDRGVRKNAVSALGKLETSRVIGSLVAALKDEDSNVRYCAASALRKPKNPRAVGPLIAALKDNNSGVRSRAAWALGGFKDPRSVEPLIAAFKDVDKSVRSSAVTAFLGFKDPRAVGPLIAALKDDYSGVRSRAVSALGGFKDPRSVGPLIAALKDKDRGVRSNAAWALTKFKDPRAVGPFIDALKDDYSEVRSRAASGLGELRDSRAIEPLIAALKDGNINVRSRAASALGRFKDSRAVEPLIAALKDENKHVHKNAARALGKIKDPRAVQAIKEYREKK